MAVHFFMIRIDKHKLTSGFNRIEGMIRPLSVGIQNNEPILWFLHNDEPGICYGTVKVAITGENCPSGEFIGTFQIQSAMSQIVGHVFNCK